MSESTTSSSAAPVIVVGFDMPFWPLVGFLVKLAFASIPACIIVALIYGAIGGVAGELLLHSFHLLH